jgi:hypothetical protein
MSFPRSKKRPSVKSGTLEVAEDNDLWLDYGDEGSLPPSSNELLENQSVHSIQAYESGATTPANCVPPNYLSDVESAILRSEIRPISSIETEE